MPREYTYEEILEIVLVETTKCLSLEPGDATPETKFYGELGGESIEILDLSFQLKKRLNFDTRLSSLHQYWEVDSSGQLTFETAEKLSKQFPTIDWADRISRLNGGSPIELITLELIAKIVHCEQPKADDLWNVATEAGSPQ